MKVIDIPLLDVDLSSFMKRLAKEVDCDHIINYDCLIKSGGVPKILYLKLTDTETKFVRQACKNIKYTKVERISTGLITKGKNRTFGLRPKRAMSQFASSCSATSLAKDSPIEHNILCDFIKKLTPFYKDFFPGEYTKNSEEVSKRVLPEWQIENTPFTSGIVNYNSELQYHYDIGHFHGALSVMLTLKNGVKGGGLCFPELGINIDLADNTILLMDGQEMMHGVTPIIKKKNNGYRYTIVYYSLLQMWRCLPITEEIIATRKMRAKRESKRANGDVGSLNMDTTKDGKSFSEKATLAIAKKVNKIK